MFNMYTWSLYFHGSLFTESFFGNKGSMMKKRTESSWKVFPATRKLSPRLSGDSYPGFQQVQQLWNILFLSVDPLGVNIAVLSCSITFFLKWKIESMDCDILSHVKKKGLFHRGPRIKCFLAYVIHYMKGRHVIQWPVFQERCGILAHLQIRLLSPGVEREL